MTETSKIHFAPAEGRRSQIFHDFLASLVVFLVALPLCMGIAIASGVPPALGLITGIVGGILVGAIAGSPLQVSGPAAGLAVIVFELVNKHGLEMLGPILMVGAMVQILAGLLKGGQWFRAISPAVVFGMLAGIGVLIFASQFHVMVDDKPRANGLLNILSIPVAVAKGVFPVDGSVHHVAAMVGLLTIVTMVLWGRFRPAALRLVPAPLVGAGVATLAANAMKLPIAYVDVPAQLRDAVRIPGLDAFMRITDVEILLAGLALAFVASAETLLSAAAVDKMHDGPRTNYDRELLAQGVGNLACGFLGSLPMTGVIVRSGANVQAGARTRLSAILHGLWLLLAVGSAPALLASIPTSALAAILVHTGYKLVNIDNIRSVARYGRMPVVIYAATLVGIVAVDLLSGVLIGIGLSLAHLIYKVSHLDIRLDVDAALSRADLHLEGAATFVRLPRLAEVLDRIPAGFELHIHFESLSYIDHACMDLLASWEKQRRSKGNRLVVEWDSLEQRFQRAVTANSTA